MKNTKKKGKTKRSKKTQGSEECNLACKTRRKIEDHLEQRRYQDELGDFNDPFDLPA